LWSLQADWFEPSVIDRGTLVLTRIRRALQSQDVSTWSAWFRWSLLWCPGAWSFFSIQDFNCFMKGSKAWVRFREGSSVEDLRGHGQGIKKEGWLHRNCKIAAWNAWYCRLMEQIVQKLLEFVLLILIYSLSVRIYGGPRLDESTENWFDQHSKYMQHQTAAHRTNF